MSYEQRLFGKKLRELRKEQSLTQEELAGLCGLSKSYISDCERGTRNISGEYYFHLPRPENYAWTAFGSFDVR
jgi:transcriptional regulator with XRE-family HTH domain